MDKVISNDTEQNGEGYAIPLKDRDVFTEEKDAQIKELCDKMHKKKLDAQSDFQREYVWQNKADLKSKLIESVLLKVPIPVVYTAEMPDGREVVVDGQQRLTTFRDFCINEFKLSKLKIIEELNKKGYSDLPTAFQERIDEYKIRVVKILKTSHPDIKFEIFERLNKGSVFKLNDQELRNCIYRGNFNDFLKKLVKNNSFLKLQNLEETDKRMKDVERILRFFAFCDKGEQNYKSPIRSFLNNYMEEKREIINEKEFSDKEELFRKCVELCNTVFSDLTGHRWMKEDENDAKNKNGIISQGFSEGIFDAQMVGFMGYSKHQILPKAQMIRDAFIQLNTKWKFIETVVQGTYDTQKTKKRMSNWFDILREIIDPEEEKRFFTYEEKKKLFDRPNGNICALCKNRIINIDDAQVDHKIPFSKGGKTELENAQLTHVFCNQSKNKKMELIEDIDLEDINF